MGSWGLALAPGNTVFVNPFMPLLRETVLFMCVEPCPRREDLAMFAFDCLSGDALLLGLRIGWCNDL